MEFKGSSTAKRLKASHVKINISVNLIVNCTANNNLFLV